MQASIARGRGLIVATPLRLQLPGCTHAEDDCDKTSLPVAGSEGTSWAIGRLELVTQHARDLQNNKCNDNNVMQAYYFS